MLFTLKDTEKYLFVISFYNSLKQYDFKNTMKTFNLL